MESFTVTTHLPNVTDNKLMSDYTCRIVVIVNNVFLCGGIGLIGIVTNVINIIIFYKQGFSSTMNISFFGLSISDLCSLITLQWYNLCMNPLFEDSDVPMDAWEVQHLTACWPHDCFARITGLITVYITAERCICVAFPLKVKQIITPGRTTFVMGFIFVLMTALLIPEYATYFVGWKYFPNSNKTLIGLIYTYNTNTEGLTSIMYAALLMISFVAVILFTITLVVKLRQKAKWRQKSISDNDQTEAISNRDKKTIQMVVLIAGVLIVSYTPTVVIYIATFLEPELTTVGDYANMHFATWSFALVFEAINSSVNLFLYYKMSMKYRETFRAIFGSSTQKEGANLSGS